MTDPANNDESLSVGCALLVVGLPVSSAIYALTAKILWGWFAVPLGAPAIGLWHAYGLALLVRALVPRNGANETKAKRKDESLSSALAGVLLEHALSNAVLLGIGWLCVWGMS